MRHLLIHLCVAFLSRRTRGLDTSEANDISRTSSSLLYQLLHRLVNLRCDVNNNGNVFAPTAAPSSLDEIDDPSRPNQPASTTPPSVSPSEVPFLSVSETPSESALFSSGSPSSVPSAFRNTFPPYGTTSSPSNFPSLPDDLNAPSSSPLLSPTFVPSSDLMPEDLELHLVVPAELKLPLPMESFFRGETNSEHEDVAVLTSTIIAKTLEVVIQNVTGADGVVVLEINGVPTNRQEQRRRSVHHRKFVVVSVVTELLRILPYQRDDEAIIDDALAKTQRSLGKALENGAFTDAIKRTASESGTYALFEEMPETIKDETSYGPVEIHVPSRAPIETPSVVPSETPSFVELSSTTLAFDAVRGVHSLRADFSVDGPHESVRVDVLRDDCRIESDTLRVDVVSTEPFAGDDDRILIRTNVDLNPDVFGNDHHYFVLGDFSRGVLSFCLSVLLDDDDEPSAKVVLRIDVDKTVPFQVTNEHVTTQEHVPIFHATTQFQSVTAYRCSEDSYDEISNPTEPLRPLDTLSVCVRTINENGPYVVGSIRELVLTQGFLEFKAVEEGIVFDQLTSQVCDDDVGRCRTTVRLIEAFFRDDPPLSVEATGIAVVETMTAKAKQGAVTVGDSDRAGDAGAFVLVFDLEQQQPLCRGRLWWWFERVVSNFVFSLVR